MRRDPDLREGPTTVGNGSAACALNGTPQSGAQVGHGVALPRRWDCARSVHQFAPPRTMPHQRQGALDVAVVADLLMKRRPLLNPFRGVSPTGGATSLFPGAAPKPMSDASCVNFSSKACTAPASPATMPSSRYKARKSNLPRISVSAAWRAASMARCKALANNAARWRGASLLAEGCCVACRRSRPKERALASMGGRLARAPNAPTS